MSETQRRKEKWERIHREQEDFHAVLEAITKLKAIQYATLRTMIFGQPTKAEWDHLMTT